MAAPPDESRQKKAEEEEQLMAKMKPYKRKHHLLERQAVESEVVYYMPYITLLLLCRSVRRDYSKHLQRPSTSSQMKNSSRTWFRK